MKFGLALSLIIAITMCFAPSSVVEAKRSSSFLLLENVPGFLPSPSGDSIRFTPLTIEDGALVKTYQEVSWRSSNRKVATVDNKGTVTLTGKPGRTFIHATHGSSSDRIAIHVTPKKGVTLIQEKGPQYDVIETLLDQMTLEEKIGQMMMPDFRTWNGQNVVEMLPEIEQMVKEYHLGGVILFRENVVETEQIIHLVNDYQDAAEKLGLLITIDQEGGIVTRLQNGTDLPGNMALGATRSEGLASQAGTVIGRELQSLGINMNLAPVLDVNNNPDNPVIGVRSFSENPELVGQLGVAYTKGLQSTGVAATAKHFPGHGDTDVDSHLGLPEVPHDRARLDEVELAPFRQAMAEGIDAIMTAHVTFPAIDDTKVISEKDGSLISLPATLSEKVLTDLMRDDLGFEGVIITDAMNMNAISDHFGPTDAVIRSINAGADIILMPVGLQTVFPAVVEAVENGEISEKRVNEAVKRILTLKLNRGILKTDSPTPIDEQIAEAERVIGSDEHRQIEQQIAEQSITVIKNEQDTLPLSVEEDDYIVVVGSTYSENLAAAFEDVSVQTEHILLSSNQSSLTAEQQDLVEGASAIIIASHSANVAGRSPSHPHMQLYVSLSESADQPVVAVAIRNPYDIMAYPSVPAYIAQYGFRDASFRASVRTIVGDLTPSGQLPVTIPTIEGDVMFEYGHGLSW
ncbi:glycoside hydrolase family 3 protein [Halalkalibacterium halodurans]|nr:glycoside hydrolase family 3 protein [Halalkalibacterium halodurans]TPE70021.1 beta-N-acetylhexosaminidase [Halalkalibacterium halodurans]